MQKLFGRNIIWVLVLAVCIVALVELVADYLLKKWSFDHRRWWFLAGGMVVYAVVGCMYGVALLLGDLTIANSIWQVLSVVSVTVMGVFLFRERPTIGQWIGIAIITAGLIVMLLGSKGIFPILWENSFWHKEWSPIKGSIEASPK